MKTRAPIRVFILAAALSFVSAVALAQTDPLAGHTAGPVMPDPVPGQGADFKPSDATAIEAYGGPPRAAPSDPCTEFNPCALHSSAPHRLGQLDNLPK